MNRRVLLAVGGGVVLGLGVIGVMAHDPHEAPAAAPFDLDSPRRPSELTKKYMDLQTAEVDFGTVQEVIRLTGTVRAMPERVRIVGSAVAGTLQKLDVRVGDRVAAGQVIGVVRSPELARLVSEQIKTEVELEHAVAEVATTRSNIAQLEAQIRATRTQAELAEDEAKRLQAGGETVGANVLAQKQGAAVAARMQVTTLEISLQQAEKMLESLRRVEEATKRQIEAIKASIAIVHDHPPGVDEDAERASEGVAACSICTRRSAAW
ncbi:MAG: HlyD family secretion protein [Phycisphaerales bacterium]|nr:HlyD family secretion protein [Phycisphaerales bacterium]